MDVYSNPVLGVIEQTCDEWAEVESERNLATCAVKLERLLPCPFNVESNESLTDGMVARKVIKPFVFCFFFCRKNVKVKLLEMMGW